MAWRTKMLILLALVCAFGLFDHSLWSGNDTREGAMIAEMVRSHTWVTPVFNGTYYLEKPPLLHWTGALLCRIFGTINEGLVRLPAALYGLASLLVMISWARGLHREAAGFAAAFMCATSALYFEYSRIVLTDSALTFMVVFSLWLFWRAYTSENWFTGRYLLFLFVSAFSFYAKGLIGPGMIWLAVTVWLIYQKRFRLLFILLFFFAFVFMLVLAPWLIALWKAGGKEFLYNVFWVNQFGRFLYFNDPSLPLDPFLIHKEPVYFYLFSLPVRLLPWTLLVIPAVYYWFRRNNPFQDPLSLFLKTAFLAIVFILHISSAKAACYALPLFPFLFLMTGIGLEDAAQSWNTKIAKQLIMITLAAVLVAAVAAPVVYMLAFVFQLRAIWAPGSGAALAGFFSACFAALTGYWFANKIWTEFKTGQRRRALLTLPAVFAVVGLLTATAFLPSVDFHRSYEPFVNMVADEMKTGQKIVFAGNAERDLGAFMFFLKTRLPAISPTNNSAFADLSGKENKSVGIITHIDTLRPVLQAIQPLPFRVKRAENAGKKSDSFRLVIINPEREIDKEHGRLKTGQAKKRK
jgi:4-amino-4-deoxy-L-arabinose transferase-like glycosyltransferase